MSRPLAALALLALAAPAEAAETSATLKVDWVVDGVVTGATLAAWGISALMDGTLVPPECRWCGTPELDARVRNAVVWSNPKPAATTSDVLAVVLPLGVGAYDFFAARAAGNGGAVGEDLLVIAEAVGVTGVLSQIVRFTTARQRPFAYYGGGTGARGDHLSFWSGHSATVFSAVAAGGTVARLRGYDGWPWVYAAGFTGAAGAGAVAAGLAGSVAFGAAFASGAFSFAADGFTAVGPEVEISGFILLKVASPMPSTFFTSSSDLNGPFLFR